MFFGVRWFKLPVLTIHEYFKPVKSVFPVCYPKQPRQMSIDPGDDPLQRFPSHNLSCMSRCRKTVWRHSVPKPQAGRTMNALQGCQLIF